MKYILNNKYILLIIVFTFFSRIVYHTNAPFFEDEGLFLLDCSKNITDLYVNTLYMKPFFGAYYYHFIYNYFLDDSFLALHISTTIFIIISNIFLYLIMRSYTKNNFISLLPPFLFLTFTHLSIGGYAHSSLEHFQLPFLLGAYYFIFIKKKNISGLTLLSFAIMIKQNVALVILTLFDNILKVWKYVIPIFLVWLFITIIFFDNFFFNNIIFPLKYYNVHNLGYKISNFIHYFLKIGYGFNLLITIGGLIFSIEFYKTFKKEFIFILLLAISLISTPMYPQHFVVIFPFLTIIFIFGFNKVFSSYNNIYKIVMGGGVVVLLILNFIKIYKNYPITSDINYLTNVQTVNFRLNGNSSGINKLLLFFETIRNEKVYIYPILFPHPYITYNFSTIDKFYSNDHLIGNILKHEFLRKILLKSIADSKPDYLIKMKNSSMDLLLKPIITENYNLYKSFGEIDIFKRIQTVKK